MIIIKIFTCICMIIYCLDCIKYGFVVLIEKEAHLSKTGKAALIFSIIGVGGLICLELLEL